MLLFSMNSSSFWTFIYFIKSKFIRIFLMSQHIKSVTTFFSSASLSINSDSFHKVIHSIRLNFNMNKYSQWMLRIRWPLIFPWCINLAVSLYISFPHLLILYLRVYVSNIRILQSIQVLSFWISNFAIFFSICKLWIEFHATNRILHKLIGLDKFI